MYLHHSKAQPAQAASDDSDSDHSPKGYMSPMKRSPSRYVAASSPPCICFRRSRILQRGAAVLT